MSEIMNSMTTGLTEVCFYRRKQEQAEGGWRMLPFIHDHVIPSSFPGFVYSGLATRLIYKDTNPESVNGRENNNNANLQGHETTNIIISELFKSPGTRLTYPHKKKLVCLGWQYGTAWSIIIIWNKDQNNHVMKVEEGDTAGGSLLVWLNIHQLQLPEKGSRLEDIAGFT